MITPAQLTEVQGTVPSGGNIALRNHAFTFGICLLLAFCFTLPGSLSPRSILLGYVGDNYQHAWFLWHFARAVAHGENPFYTRLIFYPHRVNLAWSTTDPLAAILALPLNLSLGPVAAYNISLILQLALAAFFARLLCLRVCRNEVAALIGGICFGFSPLVLAQALGHLSLVTLFPLPLYLIALDRLLKNSRPTAKDSVLLGLALFLTALCHYNFTVFCIVLTPVVIAVDLWFEGIHLLKRIWLPLASATAVFLVAFSPILKMLLGNPADLPAARPADHLDQFSADVLGFLVPSWNHILLGHTAQKLDPKLFVAGFEGTVYVGPVILFLAGLGFWKGLRLQPLWAMRAAVSAIVFYALSLGPHLRLWGRQSMLAGPALLFYKLGFAQFVSAPARFHFITALFLSVLCSIGVAYLTGQARTKYRTRSIVAVISLALLLDLLTVPFPASSITDPIWSAGLSSQQQVCSIPSRLQRGTMLTFPLTVWPYSVGSMWMQLMDQGRYALVDGYVSYASPTLWDEFYRIRLVRSLRSLQGQLSAGIDLQADRESLPADARELNLSAVVVFNSPERDSAIRYLEAILGHRGTTTGSCEVFEVSDSAANEQK